MNESVRLVAGLRTVVAGDARAPLAVVLLHGYGMRATDFAPFGRSLGLPLTLLLPEGPLTAAAGGRGWWQSSREESPLEDGAAARDLATLEPAGLDAAHRGLIAWLDEAQELVPARSWIVGGFSQGGMLALDLVLRGGRRPAGLVLLSASRLALPLWEPQRARLDGLPVYLSHGRQDPDLSFQAGEALRDFVAAGGARLEWLPFDGGHEIPLIVWRGLRKFLAGLLACAR
jgi:phospholipase/carboxylesterase